MGWNVSAICSALGRSRGWFYKWLNRYNKHDETWFKDKSRVPHNIPNKVDSKMEQMIVQTRKESKGVVVVRNGYIVGEWYWGGWDEMGRQHGYSVTKSFTSALVGMLIDDSVFVNENQVASDFIQKWQDPAHSIVTIENLLSMNSGLYWDILTDVLLVLSRNQNSYAIGLPMQYLPGVTWVYHNSATQVFS